MGLFDFLGGKIDFEEPYSQRESKNRVEKSRGRFSDMLNQIISRGNELQDEPRLTARDIFGDQMQSLKDSARATANSTKQALSRALMSGGGDITGASASNLLSVDQDTNENISDIGLRFSRLADEINRYRKRRGDRLASQALGGLQNMFTADKNTLDQVINREIQRKTARKQRGAGVFGGILNTISEGAAAAIKACWVAEELYGEDHEKVIVIRNFLFENEGEENVFGEFFEDYKEDGRAWAKRIKDDMPARMAAEKLFNELYEVAKAA